jgi:hypothetical protein
MASQPIPNVSSKDVARVVRRDFSADIVSAVHAILDDYGEESWQREPHRVRLAALKLAAGNIDRLRSAIDRAKRDYRDVLAYAEYPGYFNGVPSSGALPPESERQIIDTDWKQYQDWLTR